MYVVFCSLASTLHKVASSAEGSSMLHPDLPELLTAHPVSNRAAPGETWVSMSMPGGAGAVLQSGLSRSVQNSRLEEELKTDGENGRRKDCIRIKEI